MGEASSESAPKPKRRFLRLGRFALWALKVLAWLYPLLLLVSIGLFRFVGEQFWLTTVVMYLPRVGFALPLPFIVIALWRWGPRKLLPTQLVALWLVLVPLMGLNLTGPTPGAGGHELRVFSCNAHWGADSVETLIQEIEERRADVVALQEVDMRDLEDAFKRRWPNRFYHISTQFGLVSRYPIERVFEPEKIPMGEKRRSPRWLSYTLRTPLGPIDLYNVHPISPREGIYAVRGELGEIRRGNMPSDSGSALATVSANAELRRRQVEDMSGHAAKAQHPVLLVGDTNLPGLSWIVGHYLGKYQDGFEQSGRGFGYTFPTDRVPWMRIDRIMAGPEFEFTDFAVGAGRSSDHACVSASVRKRL